MTTKADDLEAVRQVAETLQPFSDVERERILRWARERLGMPAASNQSHVLGVTETVKPGGFPTSSQTAASEAGLDIASFVAMKAPKSDVHFAATVAYYYQFVAPVSERKDAITKEDLVDACRKAPRKRPKRPAQVLVNGYHEGLLDRGDRGQYRLNSVGENLVAMVLPADRAGSHERRKSPRKMSKASTKRKASASK